MVFDNDNQVFSFLCAKEDVSIFKKLGYSKEGRALIYVPPSADIVFFDFEERGWRMVTNNLAPRISLNLSDVYDRAFDCVESTGGKSGYYLLSHLNKTVSRLGDESEWNAIVALLDGEPISIMEFPASESNND